MARSLVPICVIANDVCADLQDTVGKHRFVITRHLVDCYRNFSTYLSDTINVKTEILPVDNEIVMPNDFLYPTKVGVLKNGYLAVLTLDRSPDYQKMSDTEVEDYLGTIWSGAYEGSGYYFYNAFRGGEYIGEMYGYGRCVRNNGTYRFDRKNGVIQIGSHIPKDSEIVVEYCADGLKDGIQLVPSEIKKMMEYYAKSEFHRDRSNFGASQENERLYKNEYRKVKRLYNFRSALYMAAELNSMFRPTN